MLMAMRAPPPTPIPAPIAVTMTEKGNARPIAARPSCPIPQPTKYPSTIVYMPLKSCELSAGSTNIKKSFVSSL